MNNKILGLIFVSIIFLSGGCGSNDYLLDEDKNVIVYEETGQQLRKDILCLPSEDTEIYEIYKEHEKQMDHKLKDLPNCENFNINSNESQSLWEGIFVKPTAYAISGLGKVVGNLGIAVILVGLLIRIVLLPLQIKTSRQTINMKKATPELQKLEKKYANKTDTDSQMMKSQEMMAIYRKYKINPLTGCLPALIQLPIFFAFLNAIYRLPSIYEQSLFGFNLGMTPSTGISNGEYQYLFLMVLIAVSTYFSFKHTMKQSTAVNEEQAKQTKTMLNFMTVMILFSSLFFPAALHFYWIVTYLFIAVQTEVINHILGEKKIEIKKINTKIKKSSIKDKLDKKEGKGKK